MVFCGPGFADKGVLLSAYDATPTPFSLVLCRETKAVKCKPKYMTRARCIYLSFFLMRRWLVWPHFFLRQFFARGGRRA